MLKPPEVPLFLPCVATVLYGDCFPFIIVTVWGIIFNALLESTLLILPFMLIRKFSGGISSLQPRYLLCHVNYPWDLPYGINCDHTYLIVTDYSRVFHQ